MIHVIITFVLIILIGVLGTSWRTKKDSGADVLKYIILLILPIIIFNIGHLTGYKEASIDTLKGKNSYEQHITKTYKDGEIISTDTTYNKK